MGSEIYTHASKSKIYLVSDETVNENRFRADHGYTEEQFDLGNIYNRHANGKRTINPDCKYGEYTLNYKWRYENGIVGSHDRFDGFFRASCSNRSPIFEFYHDFWWHLLQKYIELPYQEVVDPEWTESQLEAYKHIIPTEKQWNDIKPYLANPNRDPRSISGLYSCSVELELSEIEPFKKKVHNNLRHYGFSVNKKKLYSPRLAAGDEYSGYTSLYLNTYFDKVTEELQNGYRVYLAFPA